MNGDYTVNALTRKPFETVFNNLLVERYGRTFPNPATGRTVKQAMADCLNDFSFGTVDQTGKRANKLDSEGIRKYLHEHGWSKADVDAWVEKNKLKGG